MSMRGPVLLNEVLGPLRTSLKRPTSEWRNLGIASSSSKSQLYLSTRNPKSPSFARYASTTTTPPTQPSPQGYQPAHIISSEEDSEPPLTQFQQDIANLETYLSSKPEDLSKQLELLRSLLHEGELTGLVRYYEVVALGLDGSSTSPSPSSVEGSTDNQSGGNVIKSTGLLKSDEGWEIYVNALARIGKLSEISGKVRRRDWLISNLSAKSTSVQEGSGNKKFPGISSFLKSIGSNSSASSAATTSTLTNTTIPSSAASSSDSSSPSTATSGSPTPITASAILPTALSAGSSPSGSGVGVSGAGAGTPLSPLYVQIAQQPQQFSPWKLFRWFLGMAFWFFIILTIVSMVMENTGLLKAGPGPVEFEAEEGKVVKFSDVHGCEEAKSELEEVVEFLKNPDKFSSLGGKLPKGVLLTGPPGTGKTMLARAVAGEAGVPFLFASGSQFDEMFVGVGAKRIRELFGAAKKKAPAIVFIDELDAIGSKRSAKDAHYMKQTLNQLLVELDGFEQMEGVIIIAATNFPETLDKALTRPGRFDRHVVVGLPDVRGRIAILKHHMGEVAYDTEVDASVIARGCPGMSGADLQNLVNQAAVRASRDGSQTVQLKHFEWAKDRILMGAERKSHYVTNESKNATAYHEGGHALVALKTPGAMPLHKVTIMPRGQALGITFQLPEQDKDSYTRKEYTAMIDVALGGRAAEEMIFGHDDVTSGCSSDLQRATDVATRMIRSYGFSDKVGLVAHGDDESVYLSSKKKDEIESEIRGFLDKGMVRARNLLKDNERELHRLAKALVEYETLDLDEVKQVLEGKKLGRPGASEGEILLSEQEKKGEGQIVEGI